MGQRSQIYIKLNNIGKSWAKELKIDNATEWKDKLPEYVQHQETYQKWKQMYGEKDTIVVAFHHQWLYGRSFVLIAANILFAVKSLNKSYTTENVLHPEYRQLTNPNEPIQWIQNFMSNFFDFELSKYTRTGVERFHLLNEEHLDEDMQNVYIDNFTSGDNNDGVLLMDFTSKTPKYCFVNIHGDSTVDKLPYLRPVGAKEYIQTYFQETIEGLKDDEENVEHTAVDLVKFEKEAKQNIRVNKKFLKRIKGFQTLSVEEIIDMFPLMKGELKEHNCNVVPA